MTEFGLSAEMMPKERPNTNAKKPLAAAIDYPKPPRPFRDPNDHETRQRNRPHPTVRPNLGNRISVNSGNLAKSNCALDQITILHLLIIPPFPPTSSH